MIICCCIHQKMLAFQNLPTESTIPKAKPFLYPSVSASFIILSKPYTFASCSWAQRGVCDLVFAKHMVRFIPKYRQTHWIFTAEYALIQCLAENLCWNLFYLCITNLCQDFILHFVNLLIPKQLCPCRMTLPLIFLFHLCPKKPEVLLLGVMPEGSDS